MEKSRSLDTLELSVFFLGLQEALKSTALGSPLQGSLSPPEPPALITQSASTKWLHKQRYPMFPYLGASKHSEDMTHHGN